MAKRKDKDKDKEWIEAAVRSLRHQLALLRRSHWRVIDGGRQGPRSARGSRPPLRLICRSA
jgi:hypothetical protein